MDKPPDKLAAVTAAEAWAVNHVSLLQKILDEPTLDHRAHEPHALHL